MKSELSKVSIVSCIPINNEFPCGFYDIYKEYQTELRQIDNSISNPIESELSCIAHLDKCDNYVDHVIYYGDKKIGIVCYQNVDWLDDGEKPILYIDHFYIMPEYRHMHLGSSVFKIILDNYKGYVIFFYALAQNKNSISFWNNVIKQNNCKITRDDRCTVDRAPGDNSIYLEYVISN